MLGCGGEVSNQQANTSDNSSPSNIPESAETEDATPIKSTHDCELAEKMLENNTLWLREQEILVAIVADSTTYDAEYGDGHRVFVAYDTKNCEQIAREVLPINESPDFPYYLAEINYNNLSQLVAIKGFTKVFCFDLGKKQLLPQLEPEYKSERYGSDASAGMIQRLEIWEDYLIGYAQEFGPFAFDLSNTAQPQEVLPFAEYEMPEQGFASLFLLDMDQEGVQIIMPGFDQGKGEFALNPILDTPKKVSTNIPANARNNRFLVLREDNEGRTPIALDLKKHQVMELPADVASKKTQDILNWMKGQQ